MTAITLTSEYTLSVAAKDHAMTTEQFIAHCQECFSDVRNQYSITCNDFYLGDKLTLVLRDECVENAKLPFELNTLLTMPFQNLVTKGATPLLQAIGSLTTSNVCCNYDIDEHTLQQHLDSWCGYYSTKRKETIAMTVTGEDIIVLADQPVDWVTNLSHLVYIAVTEKLGDYLVEFPEWKAYEKEFTNTDAEYLATTYNESEDSAVYLLVEEETIKLPYPVEPHVAQLIAEALVRIHVAQLLSH